MVLSFPYLCALDPWRPASHHWSQRILRAEWSAIRKLGPAKRHYRKAQLSKTDSPQLRQFWR